MHDESQGAQASASAGEQPRDGGPAEGRRPLVRLAVLAPAVVLLGIVAGYLTGTRSADPVDLAPPPPVHFSGAAFSEQATTDDVLAEADRVTREAIAKFPESPLALSVRARHDYLIRETTAARALWERALEIDPTYGEALYGLGMLASDSDQYREAARYFEGVAQRSPGDPRTAVLLADALMKSGAVDEAMVVLEEHLKGTGVTAEALTALGQAYLQLQRYEPARRTFEAAVAAVPDMRDAVYGLARTYAHLGERRRADAYMERFRRMDAQHRTESVQKAKDFIDTNYAREVAAQAHTDAARLYRSQGDVAAAEELLQKAAALEPSDPAHLRQLLLFYADQEQYVEALHVGRRLVKLDPEDAEHWLNVGIMNAHLNQSEEALKAFRRAMELDPDHPRGRQFYALLEKNGELE